MRDMRCIILRPFPKENKELNFVILLIQRCIFIKLLSVCNLKVIVNEASYKTLISILIRKVEIWMGIVVLPVHLISVENCWFCVGFGLTSDLSYAFGLLPTVWNSSLRMVRRHAITILICHGEDGTPVLVLSEA